MMIGGNDNELFGCTELERVKYKLLNRTNF